MKRTFYLLMGMTIGVLAFMCGVVVYLDPFLHYHAPIAKFSYAFDNERYNNDGIVKHMEYDAIITGTSMTENFKTSQLDAAWGTNTIKVPYSGATYFEQANIVRTAFEYDHDLKYVLRTMDLNHMIEEADLRRDDLGDYPDYLYDDNVWNDYQYVVNKDIVEQKIYPMLIKYLSGEPGGTLSFDDYASWRGDTLTGKEAVLEGKTVFELPQSLQQLSDEDTKLLVENIRINVIDLAKEHPNTKFIYFIPPYNYAWWGVRYEEGAIKQILEAERIAIEMMLGCDNIDIFCFTNEYELTTNLDNYKDNVHYRWEINDLILDWIINGYGQLTKENAEAILKEQESYYLSFDYNDYISE